jgi:hypothetical protein
MGDDKKRAADRRTTKERRSGIDTRSEKEKARIGERRSQLIGDQVAIEGPSPQTPQSPRSESRMTARIRRTSIKTLLIASFISAQLIAPTLSADRSDEHALALSHRYGDYRNQGNIAPGQTVVIDTPKAQSRVRVETEKPIRGKMVRRAV